MDSKSITERPPKYYQLEKTRVKNLSEGIIKAEDALVPLAVKENISKIEKLVLAIVEQLKKALLFLA